MAATGMTKYTSDVPDTLWGAWKETVPRSMNLNDGIVKELAESTLEKRGDDLTDEEREEIERILEDVTS